MYLARYLLTLACALAIGQAQPSETILFNFAAFPGGEEPYAGVIIDAEGNLYGTAAAGGRYGAGVLFKIDPAGNETVLYNFTGGSDGWNPESSVVRDAAGNLYGTTYKGGAHDLGVVYKVDMSGHETVLHNFTGRHGRLPPSGGRCVG